MSTNADRILLVGGGRWSRVWLAVMHDRLGPQTEIHWITRHGLSQAHQLAATVPRKVTVDTDLPDRDDFDAALVATAPDTHFEQARHLLGRRIPTLCEKPLTYQLSQAEELKQFSEQNDVPLGVNLELHYANYLEQFLGFMDRASGPFSTIHFDWMDPWEETRYTEIKYADIYTPIVQDMFPHCWSILRKLFPAYRICDVVRTQYDPVDGVAIDCELERLQSETRPPSQPFSKLKCRVRLQRRSNDRIRRIDLDNGRLILDFSTEPGWVDAKGKRTALEWNGQRPLARTWDAFMRVVANPASRGQWPLGVANCLDSVRWSQSIANDVLAIQKQQIKELLRSGFKGTTAERNLIVDAIAPQRAQEGNRVLAFSVEQQHQFAREWLTTQAPPD